MDRTPKTLVSRKGYCMGELEEQLKKVWPRLYQNWLLLVREHYGDLNWNEQAIVNQMNRDFWTVARQLGIEICSEFKPDRGDEWDVEPETGTFDWKALK